MDSKVVNMNGEKHYTDAKEYISELVNSTHYTKFVLLALDDEGSGSLHKFNLTDEQAVTELETAKSYIISNRVR